MILLIFNFCLIKLIFRRSWSKRPSTSKFREIPCTTVTPQKSRDFENAVRRYNRVCVCVCVCVLGREKAIEPKAKSAELAEALHYIPNPNANKVEFRELIWCQLQRCDRVVDMAAIALSHKSEAFRAPSSDQFTESGPSFTAVNGTASNAQSAQKDRSDETNGLPTPPGNLQLRSKSPAPAPTPSRPIQMPIQQERVPTPSQNPPAEIPISVPAPTSAPISASVPVSNSNSAQRQEINEDPHANYVSSHSRTPSSQQSKTANTSPQKRKRSYSADYDNVINNPTYHSHGLPSSPERQRMYAPENGLVHKQETASPPNSYPPPPEHVRPHQPELYPRPERQRMIRDDYNQRVDASIAPVPPEPYYSEARMAEALVRENRNYDAMGSRETFASPEDEDEQHAQQYGEYGTNRSSQSGVDIDRKRRKRVFSNRTKTGCMTCRRRKKKCDEQHPECKLPLFPPFPPSDFQIPLRLSMLEGVM